MGFPRSTASCGPAWQHVSRAGELQRVRAQGAADAAHDDRGGKPGTRDVTHHQAQLSRGQGEHVIPVAADMTGPRHVPGGDLHRGQGRQRRGHQAALQGERGGMVLACPQRLHGHRRPVGGQLEQRGIVGGEHPVLQRPGVQHPEHRAVDQQRHAHQRPDTPLQQQRVSTRPCSTRSRMTGPPLGGDAARETPADRDPDPLDDFLLQAAGRRGDQLTARVVQQQHRSGIGIQDRPHPVEQRGEKLIGAQVRQCLIGQ